MKMGLWNKPDRRSSKRIKYEGIHNNTKRRRSTKQMAEWTTNHGIKVKIHSTMLLYSQERWFIMVGSRL